MNFFDSFRESLVCRAAAFFIGWLGVVSVGAAPMPADLVLLDAHIYTATGQGDAEALATRHGQLVYVGDTAGARSLIGKKTTVVHAQGRRILPGLVDAHIHPLDIVDLDVCDLDSAVKTLKELSGFVKDCVEHYHLKPGQWLLVHQWAYSSGGQPSAGYSTVRAALDKATSVNPVQLLGNDGHHAGFNSVALAAAKSQTGQVVGLTKATLASEFKAYTKLIGVDASGEPDGTVNEDARYFVNPHNMLYNDLAATAKVPERIPQRLNSVGITAMLDAMAAPEGLFIYDRLLKRNQLTVWTNLAQFYDPVRFHKLDGSVDYDAMVAQAVTVRARYAHNPRLKADTVKLFADGVIEGNPFALPPTLPNSAVLEPLLQPIFATDADGRATVTGYVDTAASVCIEVRNHPERYSSAESLTAFRALNGYHPAQCEISSGQLQHERSVILEFVKRFHLAGFHVHIHAIGDRATRTAIDAIEAARAVDGIATTRDGLAHVQLAHPDDVLRMGRDHLFIAYTYSWASTDTDYDMTVIPFIQKVSGNSYAALHPPGSDYESNVYPVKTSQAAGAILTGGSDAPVETRDPRPFVNMAFATARHLPGKPALSAAQEISIEEALQAYTLNGAKALGRDQQIGSLEVGKSADFVMVDRDLIALSHQGKPEAVAGTQVLATWFQGRKVYQAPVTH